MSAILQGALALAIPFIKSFEGCRLTAYPDTDGIWTIGYGCTGPGIERGTVWTQQRADTEMTARVADIAQHIALAVRVPLTDCQVAALISFVYNVGGSAFQTSTLLALLNDDNYSAVPAQLTRWVHDQSGRILPGLVARRRVEGEMWSGAYRAEAA